MNLKHFCSPLSWKRTAAATTALTLAFITVTIVFRRSRSKTVRSNIELELVLAHKKSCTLDMLREMSDAQVIQWIQGLCYSIHPETVEVLKATNLSGASLADLGFDDLKKLGITSPVDALMLCTTLDGIRYGACGTTATTAMAERLENLHCAFAGSSSLPVAEKLHLAQLADLYYADAIEQLKSAPHGAREALESVLKEILNSTEALKTDVCREFKAVRGSDTAEVTELLSPNLSAQLTEESLDTLKELQLLVENASTTELSMEEREQLCDNVLQEVAKLRLNASLCKVEEAEAIRASSDAAEKAAKMLTAPPEITAAVSIARKSKRDALNLLTRLRLTLERLRVCHTSCSDKGTVSPEAEIELNAILKEVDSIERGCKEFAPDDSASRNHVETLFNGCRGIRAGVHELLSMQK